MEGLNSINDYVLSQTLPCTFVAVAALHVLNCAGYARDSFTAKLAGAEIQQHWYIQYWHSPPPHNWILIPALGVKNYGSKQL
jgi:hypothetical protein